MHSTAYRMKFLLSKLSAYGLTVEAVLLVRSYLSGRKQQIKLNSIASSRSEIKKKVPQGSILGPLLFNVFINDIFNFIDHGILYNYADDNTLFFSSRDFDMQANPGKFEAIGAWKKTHDKNVTLNVSVTHIKCKDIVKLLGVDIDYHINFDQHVSNSVEKQVSS